MMIPRDTLPSRLRLLRQTACRRAWDSRDHGPTPQLTNGRRFRLLLVLTCPLVFSACGHETSIPTPVIAPVVPQPVSDGPYGPSHRDAALSFAKKLARQKNDRVDTAHATIEFTQVSIPATAGTIASDRVLPNTGWCVIFPVIPPDDPDSARQSELSAVQATEYTPLKTSPTATGADTGHRSGPVTDATLFPRGPFAPPDVGGSNRPQDQPLPVGSVPPPAPTVDPALEERQRQLALMQMAPIPNLPPGGVDPGGAFVVPNTDGFARGAHPSRVLKKCVVLIAIDGRTSVTVP